MTTTTTLQPPPTDPDAPFRALVSQYLNLVYASALRQLRNAHLAEDATQAVFLLLHQRAHKIPRDRLSSWLLTATRFTCTNLLKTERRRARREQVAAMNTPTVTTPSDPPDNLLPLLDAALAKLPAADREAIALHYLQNQPYAQLAATLRISEEAARKRTTRALDKLRNYFARHGLATTTAALATLLPTQAHAAPTPVHQALTTTILHTCRAGAPASTASLAQGTHTMMTLHTLKPAAIAVALLLAATGLTWYALPHSAQAAAEPPVPSAAPAPAPTPAPTHIAPTPAAPFTAVTNDLSTPGKTLDSYVKALRAGDRASLYACCAIDPSRTPTAGDAFIELNLAQNRLILAASKAFNSTGQEARQFMTLDVILAKLLAYNQIQHQSPTITGNTAEYPFTLPDNLLANAPEEIQTQVRAFTGHPLHFTKQGNDWKLDHAANAIIRLTTPEGTTIDDPTTQINAVIDYAAAYDQLATDIAAATYPTWDAAAPALKKSIETHHRKYHISDLTLQLAPLPQ